MKSRSPLRARIDWLRIAARLTFVCCCKAILLLAVLQLPVDGELRVAGEELVEVYRVIDARPSPGEPEGVALHPRIVTSDRHTSLAPLCRPQNGPFSTPELRMPLRC